MPDALTSLLGMDSPSNFGATPRPAVNVSRNAARSQLLAKYLGIAPEEEGTFSQTDLESTYGAVQAAQAEAEQRKAELSTLPERIKGEYGLQTEGMRGATARDVARSNAERSAQERETAREFTASQNSLNRDAIAGRQQATQAGQDRRADMVSSRQQTGLNESRARLYQTKDSKGNFRINAPRPADEGFLSKYLFGPSQEDLNNQEAARLRAEPAGSAAPDDIVGSWANVPDESLESEVMNQYPDSSPDEVASFVSQVRAARGR